MRPRNRATPIQGDSDKIRRELINVCSLASGHRFSIPGHEVNKYWQNIIPRNLNLIHDEIKAYEALGIPLTNSNAYVAARNDLINFIVDELAFSKDAADTFMDSLIENGTENIEAIGKSAGYVVGGSFAGYNRKPSHDDDLKECLGFSSDPPSFDKDGDNMVITYRGSGAETFARQAKMILNTAKDEFGIDGYYASHRLVPTAKDLVVLVTVPQSVFDKIAFKKLLEPELFESAISAASSRQRP